jgi:hypothetical protein
MKNPHEHWVFGIIKVPIQTNQKGRVIMRIKVKEIENVFQTHGFSIDSIIQNVMKKFNFRSLCHQVGFKKNKGIL